MLRPPHHYQTVLWGATHLLAKSTQLALGVVIIGPFTAVIEVGLLVEARHHTDAPSELVRKGMVGLGRPVQREPEPGQPYRANAELSLSELEVWPSPLFFDEFRPRLDSKGSDLRVAKEVRDVALFQPYIVGTSNISTPEFLAQLQ